MSWKHELQHVLERWRGTPWVAGQQCCGAGVDCVRFVVAVLDELHGYNLPPLPRLAQDMSLHDRAGAIAVARLIERRYPHQVIEGTSIEPGDIVVVRLGNSGGPGHVLIAGAMPGELWHAASRCGVCTTGIGAVSKVDRIWRPLERELWQRRS